MADGLDVGDYVLVPREVFESVLDCLDSLQKP